MKATSGASPSCDEIGMFTPRTLHAPQLWHKKGRGQSQIHSDNVHKNINNSRVMIIRSNHIEYKMRIFKSYKYTDIKSENRGRQPRFPY